ncbi:hypothetical protein [Pseudomonas asiatica]|uniref:hypothetical protein n=1 Tax=Pseudomonas asiatica TaxID=2219225 RepID=UPI00383A8D4A
MTISQRIALGPANPDYKSDFIVNKKPQSSGLGGVRASSMEITGSMELMSTIGMHNIRAATLLVMYWPDRNVPDAYVEVCVKEVDE